MRLALTLAAALAAATPVIAQAMRIEDVPALVRSTAKAAAMDGKIDRVATDMDGGKAIYEFEVTTKYGRKMEVDVDHLGIVGEPVDRAAVMRTLKRVLPNFQPLLFDDNAS